jgi:hypothetical protein
MLYEARIKAVLGLYYDCIKVLTLSFMEAVLRLY